MQYYNNLKIPPARIARLTLKLLDFSFEIHYKKGKENKVADALSRNPINNINISTIQEPTNLNLPNLQLSQKEDEFCKNLIDALNGKDVPTNFKRKSRQFIIKDNLLYYKKYLPNKTTEKNVVIPQNLIQHILKSYHESALGGGHTGISRTIHKIQNKYYWKNLVKDVTQFIKSCPNCQQNKILNGKPIGKLNPIQITSKPLNRLTFDYLGPLSASNKKKYIIVAVCNNTKFMFTKAVTAATAESTVKFIIQIITQVGCFQYFSSDRGTHFKNELVKKTCENLGIKQECSTAYSPQTQGIVEKINGVICASLRNCIENNDQSKWSYYLPYITLAYNATPQSSTHYSPFYLLHGFEPYFPIDNKILPDNIPYDIKQSLKILHEIRNTIPLKIQNIQQTQKNSYDKKHVILTFDPGALVLVKFPFNEHGKSPKLAPKYRGPFKIIKEINDLNYKIQLTLNNKITEDIIHVRRLKPYYQRLT